MSSPFSSWGRQRAPSIASQAVQDDQVAIPGGLARSPSHNPPGDSRVLSSSINTGSHRKRTRSFVNGPQPDQLAPLDTAEHARSVREDTAELATYILSDNRGGQGSSFLYRTRSRSSHTDHDTSASHDNDDDVDTGVTRVSHPIMEVSEPPSPGEPAELPHAKGHAEGPSILASMLRKHPLGVDERTESSDSQSRLIDGQIERGLPEIQSTETLPPPVDIDEAEGLGETTPLLRQTSSETSYVNGPRSGTGRNPDLESQKSPRSRRWLANLTRYGTHAKSVVSSGARVVGHPKRWDRRALWENVVVRPVACLPAVIVGLLLNILDALSYGMILFPLGNPIFSSLGSAGISIFYVSTIVSQLTFSWGSIFKGGVGSELIEVVPFFHRMAATITEIVGEDKPDAVIATTITSYALSSMLTGTVFYLMGKFKFGYIIGFIPRHILIGCIGGVGWFLIATGFEVTARIEGNINYDLATLKELFRAETVPLWLIPLVLAVILFYGHARIPSKYFLPLYIIAIPLVFYIFVLSLTGLDSEALGSWRGDGWIFEGPPPGEPWWHFYTLYQFNKVHWKAVAQCIPAMFALTFFGILHVPINVPALALNTGEDHADIDHELKLHGYSNFLSGALGSIQNYLVYANTLFFMRSGGDSRLAGVELAILTFGVMIIGPSLIGLIPVMMVGVLIFDLGFELLYEAVWQPRRKLMPLEYVTVLVIVLIMGIYDFVVGIGVGILLAFGSLIFQTSRVSAIRASYSGDVVGSTVRRNPTQQHYLRQVGRQIFIIKLSGYLFFGTIVSVEEKIRALISDDTFSKEPIRFLVLDMWQVTGLDYSAGEAFNTINRLLNGRGIGLVLSGVDGESELGRSLRAVGLVEDGIEVRFLPDLNSALECCENELLKIFYASQGARASRSLPTSSLEVPGGSTLSPSAEVLGSSPRRTHLHEAAKKSLSQVDVAQSTRWQSFKEPLRLMLQIFQDMSDKNEDFWFRAVSYFTREEYPAGTVLFRRGEPAEAFYLIESGILRAEYDLPQGWLCESVVAGTTCGELPFFSETDRTATAVVERDCVIWMINKESWAKLQKEEPDVAQELLRISLKLTTERMSVITSYVLTTAG